MKFPISMTAGLAKYIFKNKMHPRPEWQINGAGAASAANPFRILPPKAGEKHAPHPMIAKRFPIVLMLEPLHACNLSCAGCGRIREYADTVSQRMTVDECLAAADECGSGGGRFPAQEKCGIYFPCAGLGVHGLACFPEA